MTHETLNMFFAAFRFLPKTSVAAHYKHPERLASWPS